MSLLPQPVCVHGLAVHHKLPVLLQFAQLAELASRAPGNLATTHTPLRWPRAPLSTRRNVGRRLAALLSVVLLALAMPAGAVFVDTFDVVARSTADGIDAPQVAPTPDGRAVVVWSSGGSIERRVIAVDGSMGSVAALPKLTASAASNPKIAVDALGRISVVWQEDGKIMHNRLDIQGGLGTTQMLIDATNAADPDIALDAGGGAVVGWTRGAIGSVQAIRLTAANAQPVRSATSMSSAHQSSPPGVAVDSSGRATVVWRRQNRVETRFLGADGFTQGDAFFISPSTCTATLPRISAHPDSASLPFVVFRQTTCVDRVRGAFAVPGSEHLLADGILADDPGHLVRMGSDGRANYVLLRVAEAGQTQRVLFGHRSMDGTGFAALLSAAGVAARNVRLAIGAPPDERVLVVWIESDGGQERVRGRHVAPDNTIGPLLTLSGFADADTLASPAVAMAPGPLVRGTVVWREPTLTGFRLRATQDVGPPQCISPIQRIVLANQVAQAIFPRNVCAGRLDEEGDLGLPPVEIVEEPAIGSVQVFLGAILYQAVGGGYSETFRFRTSGPGGHSNVVLVQVQVLDGDVMFRDGFESTDF
jgi:hypothetical protein